MDATLIGNIFDYPILSYFKIEIFGQMLLPNHAMQQKVKGRPRHIFSKKKKKS